MAEGEKPFRGEISVRELITEEHANDGGQWEGVQDPRLLGRCESETGQVAEDQRQPCPPNEELQHHHEEESQPDCFVHAFVLVVKRCPDSTAAAEQTSAG